MEARLVDMHCHLDRIADAPAVASDAARLGIAILDTTVAPREALLARRTLGSCDTVRVGVGLHPWWLSDGSCTDSDVDLLVELVSSSAFVGEVGLDFSHRHEHARERQLEAFCRMAETVAERHLPHRVLSIHAVRSAGAALDVLERYRLAGKAAPPGLSCIFHWFSGTSDELARARRAGCFFSVNEHMLATKRGREYARIIPEDRLLLETDAPPQLDAPWNAQDLEASLARTLDAVAAIRNVDSHDLGAHIAQTSLSLLC